MKIVFMGTPNFSSVVFEKLNSVYPISTVVTGLDKPVGRGYIIMAAPLKVKANELGVPVLQYEKVSKEGIEDIEALKPDLIITAALGQILSERFLQIPKFGVLNVHASLLPKYRGASPIQWAILNGEKETGITIMKTVKAVDAGDILLQKSTEIGKNETAGELFSRLSTLGGEAIIEAVRLIESGKAVFTKQDDSEATHCSMISKADGKIDFSKSAEELDCFLRGMSPWPSAYTELYGKILKVHKIESVDNKTMLPLGEVITADTKNGITVACKGGAVRLCEIQLEGSKRMVDTEFLRGRSIEIGYRFD
ncbi:MAG: methionyl-tRNA formyltransferase [Clostridia bacterium]